jgi:hypothetical protein
MHTQARSCPRVDSRIGTIMPTLICSHLYAHIGVVMPTSVYAHIGAIMPTGVCTNRREHAHACKYMGANMSTSICTHEIIHAYTYMYHTKMSPRVYAHICAIMPMHVCAQSRSFSYAYMHIKVCDEMSTHTCAHRRNHAHAYVHTLVRSFRTRICTDRRSHAYVHTKARSYVRLHKGAIIFPVHAAHTGAIMPMHVCTQRRYHAYVYMHT